MLTLHPPPALLRCALALSLTACAPADPTPAVAPVAPSTPATLRAVPDAPRLRISRDPGLPPHEQPPRSSLWQLGDDGWQVRARVLAAAPGGRAWVDLERRLVVDGAPVLDGVWPELSMGPDGAIAFTRATHPPDRDVWRLDPGLPPRAVTADGVSDRPLFLPDGRLLWVSSAATGRATWVDANGPLELRTSDGAPLHLPPPAWSERTRVVGDRVHFDAGDSQWWFDPSRGVGGRR